jgi:hypothetical protein
MAGLFLARVAYFSRHAGLVPGIHIFAEAERQTWMAGTSPAMTKREAA